MKWKQLGVKELSKNGHFPFFVQWQSDNHPSKDLEAKASISAINLRGPKIDLNSWINSDIANYKQIALEDTDKSVESEIISVTFESNGNLIEID